MVRKSTKIDRLTKEERKETINRLLKRQDYKSYVSQEEINPSIHEVDIDHIISLDRGGIDEEMNWGVLKRKENQSKGNKDLQLMRYLYEFNYTKEKYLSDTRDFTFGDALKEFFPRRQEVKFSIYNGNIKIFFKENGDMKTYTFTLFTDENDKETISFIAMLPFNILYHDSSVNPRSIVDLEPMIQEFYNKNPQLFPSLAILEVENNNNGKIKVFDGQHKAAAQLFLRSKNLFIRVFVNAQKTKLKRTNFRAHTSLAQIHFPQMISDKVGCDLFSLKFNEFLNNADLEKESERSFLKREEISDEYKKFLRNYLRYRVLMGDNGDHHKILHYVETVSARSKTDPISYDTLLKTFLKILRLNPVEEKLSVSMKYRKLELKNLQKLMDIFVEEVLEGKFEKKLGIFKLEQKVIEDPNKIPDNHLISFRMCRQAAMVIWLEELKKAISLLLKSNDKYFKNEWSDNRILWAQIDDNHWRKIRNMIKVITQHQVWKTKVNQEVLFSLGSTKQKDWKEILLEGRLPGREESLFDKLNDTKIYNSALRM